MSARACMRAALSIFAAICLRLMVPFSAKAVAILEARADAAERRE